MDYYNSIFAGIPGQLQARLQSVLNAAARFVFSARRSERITPLLRELHWLLVPSKSHSVCAFWPTAVFMEQRRRTSLRAFSGHLTSTLDALCVMTQPCWWYRPPDVQRSATVPSQWLRHVPGTACRRLSGMHRRWRRSVANWRLYFFVVVWRSWLYCTV